MVTLVYMAFLVYQNKIYKGIFIQMSNIIVEKMKRKIVVQVKTKSIYCKFCVTS